MRTDGSPRKVSQVAVVLALVATALVVAGPSQAQPAPTISVDPQWDSIFAHSFTANVNLTIEVYDADPTGGGSLIHGPFSVGTDDSGVAEFQGFDSGVDLQPDMFVRVSEEGGGPVKELTIHDLAIDIVDPVSNSVGGTVTAPDGTDVVVNLHEDSGPLGSETVQVASDAWEASFADVDWPHSAFASVFDGDGDSTGLSKQPPRIEAFPQWSSITGHGFVGGSTVTFSVMEGATELLPSDNTRTADAYGEVDFTMPDDCCGGFDVFQKLRPGMVVEADDGTTSKDVTLSGLTIDIVDLDLSRVTGTAAPDQTVSVERFDPALEFAPPVFVQADGPGSSTPGRWQVDLPSITTQSSIHAKAPDAENDSENDDFHPPSIQASQNPNWWGGLQVRIGDFNPGTLMTLTILGPGGGTLLSNTYPLEDGRFERDFGNIDAVPGTVIRATDGVYSKELVVGSIAIDNIDPTSNTVLGTADPGAMVNVNAGNGSGGSGLPPIQADEVTGEWIADFSGTGFTIDIDTDAFASMFDDDGDALNDEKFRRIIGIGPTTGDLSADGFAADSPITFEIFDQPESGGGTRQNPSDVPVTSDAFGHAEFRTDIPLDGGMEIAITDGFGERRGVLPDITIDSIDPTFDSAGGTAPPGTEFAGGSKCGLTEQLVTADGSGEWSLVDYVFDIIHTAQACNPSPAPAGVDIHWNLSTPIVSVDPVNDLIVADGFDASGGDITFEIYDAPGGNLLHAEAVTPSDFTDENGSSYSGHAELNHGAHGQDLAPGMFVTAVQGATTKEHEIMPLTVDVADPVTSDVSGTATVPGGGELIVALDLQFVLRPDVIGGAWEITEADRTFDCGEVDPCLWQLEHEAVVMASVIDDDGDRTAVDQGAAEQVTCNDTTSCTTDNEAPPDGSTEFDPVETTVTSPTAGTIRIAEEQLTRQAPDTFAFLGQQIDIDAPNASVEDPLEIVVRLDATGIPKGQQATDLQMYRNGSYVPDCATGSGGQASPDPCVSAREKLGDGDAQLTMRSSQASDWNAGASNDARAPNVDTVSFSVNPKQSSQATVLTATASDALSGVGGGEYFIGDDPGQGQGNQMLLSGSSLEATIGTLDPGTYQVGMRARDKAGNWSEVTTVELTVEPDPPSGGGGGGGGGTPSPSPTPTPTPSVSPSPTPTPSPSPTVSPPPIDPSCGEEGVICGTDGDDLLTGTDGDDLIIGGDGDDTIIGGDGNDTCIGGGGNDSIDCGPGNDLILGGAGDDELVSHGGSDTIRGGAGMDLISGGAGDDLLIGGSDADRVYGRRGADRLVGRDGNDLLIGGGGPDTIVGGEGRDEMRGRRGNDLFRARDGYIDIVRGGRGRDVARRDDFDKVFSVP